MKRYTQNMLYHLLPIVFWLLATGGIVVWGILQSFTPSLLWDLVPALLALIAVIIIRRIPRHTECIEQCFHVTVMVSIAAYWLPSVIFLMIPIWGYLIYQNLFNARAFSASLIGFALVAVWAVVLDYLSLLTCHFDLAYNVWAWVPTGAILLAWLASTIARQSLRVR